MSGSQLSGMCVLAVMLMQAESIASVSPEDSTLSGSPASLSDTSAVYGTPSQRAADALFSSVGATFAEAPVVMTATKVRTQSGGREQEMEVLSIFGPNGEALVEGPSSAILAREGRLNIVLHDVWDRYLSVPVGKRIADGVEAALGDRMLAGFEVMMRDGDPPGLWLDALMMRSIGSPKVISIERRDGNSDTSIVRIELSGRFGKGWIDIDSGRRVILGCHSEMLVPMEDGREPFAMTMDMTTEVVFADAILHPLELDMGIRTPVSHRNQLDPVLRNALAVGDVHPPLKGILKNGDDIDLASMRGEYVVLCFWSTWADASRGGVELLERLSASVADHPDIHCLAVNVWERGDDPAAQHAQALAAWAAAGFALPMVHVGDDSTRVQWGITTLPYLVTIAPDGRILDLQVGWDDSWLDRVRNLIRP